MHDGWKDKAAVWTGPLKSFYAVRGIVDLAPWTWDLVAAMTRSDFELYDISWTPYKGRNTLFGNVLQYHKDALLGEMSLFYREDTSDLDNDTVAMSLRGEYDLEKIPNVTLSGEIVKEYGETMLQNGVISDEKHDRDSWGGHLDAKYTFKDVKTTPYIKGSVIYLTGDDPSTDKNESFDPLFFGFYDWGHWYIGDISSWSIAPTNQRAGMLEIGCTPAEKMSLRLQYFYITLDRDMYNVDSKQWCHEWDLIFGWNVTDHIYCGIMTGYARPLEAAKEISGGKEDCYELLAWTEISF